MIAHRKGEKVYCDTCDINLLEFVVNVYIGENLDKDQFKKLVPEIDLSDGSIPVCPYCGGGYFDGKYMRTRNSNSCQ